MYARSARRWLVSEDGSLLLGAFGIPADAVAEWVAGLPEVRWPYR
jgi:hypothetical protein